MVCAIDSIRSSRDGGVSGAGGCCFVVRCLGAKLHVEAFEAW